MDDFLRNKLNAFEDSNDGWDRPDAAVWEEAQRQIPGFASPAPIAGALAISGALLVVLLLGGYIGRLQQDNTALKTALETQQGQMSEVVEQLDFAKKMQADEQDALVVLHEALRTENAGLLRKNIDLEQQLRQQQIANSWLKSENLALQKSRDEAEPNFSDENINPSKSATSLATDGKNPVEIPSQNLAPLPVKSISLVPTALPAPLISGQTIPSKNERKRFEIGYEYALLGLKIPVQSDFIDLNAISNKVNNTVFTHSHGLFFGYSPKQNWFVRSGLRTAEITLEQNLESGVYYDKTSEYVRPNGGTANDINLAFRTPYNELESEITLIIPQDANLKTGDWLVFGTYERIRQRYYQVPLGVSYFHGNGRLQWQLHGGAQWNMVVFDDYFLKAYVMSKNKVLTVDKVNMLTKNVPSTQYLSGYAGFGLNWQLFDHWHVRAGMIYSYDFNSKNSKKFLKSKEVGSAFNLGLNYRF